jgi:hypothetical protein
VAAPTPQAVGPDVAKLLVVVTLRKGVFEMEMWQRPNSLKRSWDFAFLGRVTRKRGKVMDVESSGDRRSVDICLALITSKQKSTNPSAMFSAGMFSVLVPLLHLRASSESTTATFADETAVVTMDSDPAIASQKLQTDLLAIQNCFKMENEKQ